MKNENVEVDLEVKDGEVKEEVERNVITIISEKSTCKTCYGRGFINMVNKSSEQLEQVPCPKLVSKFRKIAVRDDLGKYDCDFKMNPDKYGIENLSVVIFEEVKDDETNKENIED
jgi:hypothetical protein